MVNSKQPVKPQPRMRTASTHSQHFILTNDQVIRKALRKELEKKCRGKSKTKIVEELGVTHGKARIDIAVVNGNIHGYELKSDKDTLKRLPYQIKKFNSVFDFVTIIVGKTHLYEAIQIVPEWWGIRIAKMKDHSKTISFYEIRKASKNPSQDSLAIAALLWREEALTILEEIGKAKGVRSKSKKDIYKRLVETCKPRTLNRLVREYLRARTAWRSDLQYIPSGD